MVHLVPVNRADRRIPALRSLEDVAGGKLLNRSLFHQEDLGAGSRKYVALLDVTSQRNLGDTQRKQEWKRSKPVSGYVAMTGLIINL